MKGLVVAAALVAAAGTARADDPKIQFEKYTLPNGLEVILAPDPSVPIVAVDVWYHVGSGDEVVGRSGFAHLFEHLMFQGSKNTVRKDTHDVHFEILRKLGADNVNGSTNFDRTNYFEVVPSNQLETAVWLESDRMGHLLDVIDKGEMANQIDVVRNERRQREDNRPYGKTDFATYEALYPEGHPYRYEVIGRHEDLEAATIDDAKKFFMTWYVPSNATVAIVGDFDPAVAKKLVDKWFATFPKSEKPRVVHVPAPTVTAKTVTVEDPFAKLPAIKFAWHSPANFADGDAELDFVADALAREGTGRLYRTLVYEKQLAQSVRADQSGMGHSGIFEISVTLRSGTDPVEVEKIVMDEVAKVVHGRLEAKEMARLVAQMEARVIRGMESVVGRAEALQNCNQWHGDPGCITWELDRYRKATPEQIQAAAAKYLVPERMIKIVTIPVKGGAR